MGDRWRSEDARREASGTAGEPTWPITGPPGDYNVDAIVDHLRRYAFARDRPTDRQLRTITITDDDAIVILAAIDIARQPPPP